MNTVTNEKGEPIPFDFTKLLSKKGIDVKLPFTAKKISSTKNNHLLVGCETDEDVIESPIIEVDTKVSTEELPIVETDKSSKPKPKASDVSKAKKLKNARLSKKSTKRLV